MLAEAGVFRVPLCTRKLLLKSCPVKPAATDQTPSEHPRSDTSRAAVASFAEGDVDPAYDSAGVDRSLIRWMLSLTPSE